jgi:hypothetical protein
LSETRTPRLTRAFALHYAEMVAVMLLGMAALALPAQWTTDALLPSLDPDDPALMLGRMAAIMTIPMVPWMRWRGHGWRPCLEMAGAMLAPGAATVALAAAGVLTSVGLLMTVEHVAMFAAMFAVMFARPEEYSGAACHRDSHRATADPTTGTYVRP